MSLSDEEKAALEEARLAVAMTRRPTVPAIDELLHQVIPVLDHGFVRVIDYSGDDAAIVQAARVSYGKGTRKTSEDRQLIRYLVRHRHTSPFEMCELKLHVKMPIFVARQWIRHRTANVNEVSGRYSVFTDEFYVPDPEALAVQSSDNKQGRGATLSPEASEEVRGIVRRESERAYATYQQLLSEHDLARELARAVLPVNYYTQWYWKIDLHNLLHFLALRMDRHAQLEIRVYADAIAGIVEKWVPLAYEAFRDYRLGSFTLSSPMQEVLRGLLRGETPNQRESGLSKREWEELMEMLGRA
jgi:thymidylate synthase (FAD)